MPNFFDRLKSLAGAIGKAVAGVFRSESSRPEPRPPKAPTPRPAGPVGGRGAAPRPKTVRTPPPVRPASPSPPPPTAPSWVDAALADAERALAKLERLRGEGAPAAAPRPRRPGRPGSIRGEAAARGVTEARIRRERAIAEGFSPSQASGHPRKGEMSLRDQRDWYRADALSPERRAEVWRAFDRAAKESRLSAHDYFSKLVSPKGKGRGR